MQRTVMNSSVEGLSIQVRLFLSIIQRKVVCQEVLIDMLSSYLVKVQATHQLISVVHSSVFHKEFRATNYRH